MNRDTLARGIEAGIASFLRSRVAGPLLDRPEIAAALGPERLAALKAELLATLERSEREGEKERQEVEVFLREVVGESGMSAVRTATTLANVLFERAAHAGPEAPSSTPDSPSDPRHSPSGGEGRAP
jgi:hypothetical protein